MDGTLRTAGLQSIAIPMHSKHGLYYHYSCRRGCRLCRHVFGVADCDNGNSLATTGAAAPIHPGNAMLGSGLPSQCSWSCAPVTVPARQSGAYEFNDLCLFVGLSGTESKIGIWGVFPMKVQNRLAKKNIKNSKIGNHSMKPFIGRCDNRAVRAGADLPQVCHNGH